MGLQEGEAESQRVKRLKQRENLHREKRHVLLIQACMVGLLAGVLAVAYESSVSRISEVASGVASNARTQGPISCFLLVAGASTIGGFAAYLIGRYVPESGGSGIPHVKAVLLHMRSIRTWPLLVAKFFGGLAAILAGMSFGREGPTIQMGAVVGKWSADVMHVSRRSRTTLIAAGAGAGLAAAFNAPLAGFLFVMEELRREMSALTYGSALAASVFAVAVTRYVSGLKPEFVLRSPGAAPLSIMPLAAVLGVFCGLGGVLFNRALLGGLEIRSKFHIRPWMFGAAVGVLSGLALLYFPSITGGGYALAGKLLEGQLLAAHLLYLLIALFFGKLLLTAASYGTGLPGGIFAPILVLGAVLGFLFGTIVHRIDPSVPFSNGGFATMGMAALLAGSVRAPLTGVVLIVEMTAEYGLLYSLLICAFAASLTAEGLKDTPIYEALMERDLHKSGVEIEKSLEPILLEVLIEPNSLMDGVRVKHLKLPVGAILTTIQRDTQQIVPGGNTVLRGGDMATVLIEGDKPELSLKIHEEAKAP